MHYFTGRKWIGSGAPPEVARIHQLIGAGTNPETRIRARPFFLGKRACAAKHLVRLVRYLALPAVVASGTSTSFPDFTS